MAAQAIRAGLVDEYRVYVGGALVGGGNRLFPGDVRAERYRPFWMVTVVVDRPPQTRSDLRKRYFRTVGSSWS
ncbi:dihydrofolate reductase family protein [Georgenia yuyongxinii]|uniref:Bacterial bifunctional deaminase-reductase C-terminal domain-containing protein n=1 Tax=Georgenia yuyongxinii TaxID=2589797 RepID=A0A552WRH0_9MICO|nr:dihydrofolate reductase family protein [Georgenia yuyongxinii]TRW45336.1 hypothetical protein FJ693_10055 [Georgenia yuyongxinii]